ncbi:uncharacterized protein (TIGR03118 family) [Dinghuibacter silviterrae]|uniref:Uncharacterized protein (TIGR03118 family) n=2 Tax=Dinghuibacter silviterrae TaxID=1539049 RepID=A0A4R8DGS8_9BACT|nr:uncharacterized protein (TIGR03118 family) [Dinghuibacter silviterrae]
MRLSVVGGLFVCLLGTTNCRKVVLRAFLDGYQQTNLVASNASYSPVLVDSQLVNPWGMAFTPTSPVWISDNGTGLSTLYDHTGKKIPLVVTIPSPDSAKEGKPTGVLFNPTADFMIPAKPPVASRFIFATEDGTIIAWGGGTKGTIVADRSEWGAVYKGIALDSTGGQHFLYATNFHAGTIDVFDKDFNYVSGTTFHDPGIPHGFAPFNIRSIGGWLWVTYAKQLAPADHYDEAGPGNGFIDIFTPGGALVSRFATRGPLNSPWGIVPAKEGFVKQADSVNVILVGNFGDGRINMYTDQGIFLGPLMDHNRPIVIGGLWDLENDVPGTTTAQLFFTAGPNGSDGIFGFLERK